MMMKKKNFHKAQLILCLAFVLLVSSFQNSGCQTFCIQAGADQITGEQDGYRYELWDQNSLGTACMTLDSGALFSGEWSGIVNYLARRGLGYDQTQEHQEIGTFYATYNCNYNPLAGAGGNSYLSVYGWTVNPLVEYYIIEDWRNWIPSMAGDARLKGSLNVNGSIYDIYENTRVNQPSIVGTATFQQYFSIRRNVRNGGTINISEHFNAWEALGMDMGDMHEVSFVVEGYQNSGNFEFTELAVFLTNDPVHVTADLNVPEYLSIYPNPNDGNVAVKLDESFLNASVKIYDALGKIIFSLENIKNNLIEVSNLKRGMYVVNVNSNRRNYTDKFFVD
jgi:endo-1,4-beta-xylanase